MESTCMCYVCGLRPRNAKAYGLYLKRDKDAELVYFCASCLNLHSIPYSPCVHCGTFLVPHNSEMATLFIHGDKYHYAPEPYNIPLDNDRELCLECSYDYYYCECCGRRLQRNVDDYIADANGEIYCCDCYENDDEHTGCNEETIYLDLYTNDRNADTKAIRLLSVDFLRKNRKRSKPKKNSFEHIYTVQGSDDIYVQDIVALIKTTDLTKDFVRDVRIFGISGHSVQNKERSKSLEIDFFLTDTAFYTLDRNFRECISYPTYYPDYHYRDRYNSVYELKLDGKSYLTAIVEIPASSGIGLSRSIRKSIIENVDYTRSTMFTLITLLGKGN